MRRFSGALVALVALIALVVAWVVTRPAPEVSPVKEAPPLFAFEKEDIVGVRIQRPDLTIELRNEGGEWIAVGQPWKPSRSMIRRVAHQTHDLTARATVAEDTTDPALYGFTDRAVLITITLQDGKVIEFEGGDPNPTSVSHYIRPKPGNTVYTVKKSALDFYKLPLEEFREDKLASFDADDADLIDATVDGRHLRFVRSGEKTWREESPRQWDAAREEVRTMLGRTAALKAQAFVYDGDDPAELAKYGLAEPVGRIAITLTGGDVVTVLVGDSIPGTNPTERYVYRVEHKALFAARDSFLEAFQLPDEKYRKREFVGRNEWEVQKLTVSMPGQEPVVLTRSSDAFLWDDGSPVAGSTPKRLAARAAEANALAFHDTPPKDAGLDAPSATVVMEFDGGTARTLVFGRKFEVKGPDGLPQTRFLARADGDPTVYEVDDGAFSVVEDVFREYRRKQERDAERRLKVEGDDDGPENGEG